MTIREKVKLLKQFPFFARLQVEVLEALAQEAEIRDIPRNQYVYIPGKPSEEFYLLIGGRVKTGDFSQGRRENVREILHPLAYFGELCLTCEPKRTGFAFAMQEGCKLMVIRADMLMHHMLQNLQLNMLIMELFGRRVRSAEHRVSDMINKNARTRVLEYIKETVLSQGRRVGTEIYFKHGLTQIDIASITGTSRQTVTQVLNDLRKTNSIHFTRNSIIIREPEKFKTCHLP